MAAGVRHARPFYERRSPEGHHRPGRAGLETRRQHVGASRHDSRRRGQDHPIFDAGRRHRGLRKGGNAFPRRRASGRDAPRYSPALPARVLGRGRNYCSQGVVLQEGNTMKAIRLHKRGGPEQLVYEDAPKPELSPGDALIRVRATGITPTELTWAETYSNCDGSERLPTIPGHEVSGVVESVADGVSDVAIGDEVYALTSFCRNGSAAEYVAVRAADLAPKPKTLDHAQA